MTVSVTVKRTLGAQFELLPDARKRLADPVRPIGSFLANRVMRQGPAGVFDHFHRQAELPLKGGSNPWLQSIRALAVQGGVPGARGTPLTLVDQGPYRAAWEDRGPGTVTEITARSVAVGVNPGAFPHVVVFQSESQVGNVAPRPISVSKGTLERFEAAMLDWILRGRKGA